uniref:Transmembrane protein n=1 Tax=Vespula pensylvanica TaxID=30213 RepID=A0A834NQR6_VESPE|nr:hypothetical protein H0235_012202 [Vespula pensylvanica]
MNEDYVDAEAGVIKSQKQPLLLTPWTNLSSWVLDVLAPIPPVSTVTSDGSLPLDHHQTHKPPFLYPPPVIVLVYSVICGFYWSSTTSSSSTYFPSTLFSSTFRLFLYSLSRILAPLVACSI